MALPLIIAAASGGALIWSSVESFLFGDEPQTVINAQPGSTVNTGSGFSLTSPLVLGGVAIAAWWLFKGRS